MDPRPHLIDPLDVDGWHSGLARLLTDDDWWHTLRDGVEALARPFTWESCARDTLGVYQQIIGKPVSAVCAGVNPLFSPGSANRG